LSAKSAAAATTSRCDRDNDADWLQRLHANWLVTTTLGGNGS